MRKEPSVIDNPQYELILKDRKTGKEFILVSESEIANSDNRERNRLRKQRENRRKEEDLAIGIDIPQGHYYLRKNRSIDCDVCSKPIDGKRMRFIKTVDKEAKLVCWTCFYK